jgi:hypothetical protein
MIRICLYHVLCLSVCYKRQYYIYALYAHATALFIYLF